MHVAEMDFEVAQPIRELLRDMVENSDLGYLGPLPELEPAFAGFASKRWGWEVLPGGIKLATDVGIAAVEILRAVGHSGEKVMVNSPVYSAFFKWIEEVGMVPHDAPLRLNGDRWELDLKTIESGFEGGVKILLLCSPQNPVGTIHSRSELEELAALAKKYDVLVISDEIHAPLSWGEFTPYLAVSDAARETGVTITSSSKSWNTAGLKAGFLMTQSDAVRAKLAKLPEAMNWRASLLGAFSMVCAFNDCIPWLDETVATIQDRVELLRRELANQLPKAKMFEMESTYLAWIDLGAYQQDRVAGKILAEAKVALVPGEDHGSTAAYGQFVRFNVATSEARLVEAVSRMARLLEG